MKTATIAKPKSRQDETLLRLFCASLSGVSSQLEHLHSLEAGLPAQDLFAKDLHQREVFAVKRAFRLATLAREELQVNQFNSQL